MNQTDWEEYITKLDNVQQEENYGYLFFFVGDDHKLPFATIGYSDNDYDKVSNLNREGIFRINIGVTSKTYESLIGNTSPENVDYSALDVFMPHHHYAKQRFVCILNPTDDNVEITRQLITEAHGIAASRLQRKTKK